MHLDLETLAQFDTLEQAQQHIDQWIIKRTKELDNEIVKKQRKKSKKITYVDYP